MIVFLSAIEESISRMEPGRFQVLCDAILSARGYEKRSSQGRKLGSLKTVKGTPDAFYVKDGKFVFCECTTQTSNLLAKIIEDVGKCLSQQKTRLAPEDLEGIVYFSGASDLTPAQLRQVTEHALAQGINLEYFGPFGIAGEIYTSYPWMAKDFFGIEIGAKEITDCNGFLAYYDQAAAGPSLANPYVKREEEMSALAELLTQKRIIVVTGKAGVGKTKLVIETASTFAEENNYEFLCIRSCQAISHSDVMRIAPENGKTLVLFDDVNKMSSTSSILELASMEETKAILTVRDYAVDELMNSLQESFNHNYICENIGILRIPVLSDEEVEKIAKASFGIDSPLFLKQIKQVASGNARLAVMACETVLSRRLLGSIQDASSLYESYYSGVMRDCFDNEKVLIAAGIVALLSPFDLEVSEPVASLLECIEMSLSELRVLIRTLHDIEIVDLARDRAVALSDQSLQVFLMKKVFLDKKLVALADALIHCYEKRPQAITNAIRNLLHVFGSEEVQNGIEGQIILAWDHFETTGTACFNDYCETFGVFNPEKALLTLKRDLDCLPEEEFDANTLNFDKAASKGAEDKYLSRLNAFGYGEHAASALQLILEYYKKKPANGLQVYRVITESYCFDPDNLHFGYSQEILVLNKLKAFLVDSPTKNNEILFIEIARYLLKTAISVTRHSHNNTWEHLSGALPLSTDADQYRVLLWNELTRLYGNPEHRARIDNLLVHYGSDLGSYGGGNADLVQLDMESIKLFVKTNLSSNNVDHVLIVSRMVEDFRRGGIGVDSSVFGVFVDSPIRQMLQILEPPERVLEEAWDDRQTRLQTMLEEYAGSLRGRDIPCLVDICLSAEKLGERFPLWQINTNLLSIIETLAAISDELFVLGCQTLLEKDIYPNMPLRLTAKLISVLGAEETYHFLSGSTCSYADIWLYAYFITIPEEALNEIACKRALAHFQGIKQSPRKTPYLDIIDLSRYKEVDSEILVKVCVSLLEKYHNEPSALRPYFDELFNGRRHMPVDIINEFRGSEDLLVDLYRKLHLDNNIFDADNSFLHELLRQNLLSVPEILEMIVGEGHYLRLKGTERLSFIWGEHECLGYASAVFDWIHENESRIIIYESSLFVHVPKEHPERLDEWVKQTIDIFASDADKMRVLSNLLSNLPDDLRAEYTLYFLNCNKSFTAFQKWRLFPGSMSWSGSAIPIYNERFEFLDGLKRSLTGIDYLEHCALLAEQMRDIAKTIEEEEVRDFLRGFN